jgi:hypothetical protein
MFKCDSCKKIVGPRVTPTIVVMDVKQPCVPDYADGRTYVTIRKGLKLCPECDISRAV